MTRDNLNFLKVLETNRFVNKDRPDKVSYKSLPLNERSEDTESTEVVFDFNSIASKKVRANPMIGETVAADFTGIVNQIRKDHRQKNSSNGSFSDENVGKEKQEQKKQIEEYSGEGFITSNSLREYYGKLARMNLMYSGQDSSISPILPINLSLTTYGNTYLNNGDIFNQMLAETWSEDINKFFKIVAKE